MIGFAKNRRKNARGRSRPALLALALFAAAVFIACSSPSSPTASPHGGEQKAAAVGPAEHGATRPDVGFASRRKLVDHYEKHGREFGLVSMEDYLRMAQELRDRPSGGDVVEARRRDGTVTRFDRSSGAFVAFNANGVIRTFFKPADGEAYFKRQLRRQH